MLNMDNLSLDEIYDFWRHARVVSNRHTHTNSFSDVEACIDDDSASNEEESSRKEVKL